ncbi:hypothetical protein pben1_p71 [Paracoccus phage vB_PbeS_Pben1]|nr:hypothetical protein pben1_p71 [Paracoccus phage vB_PbeS_Pben1]
MIKFDRPSFVPCPNDSWGSPNRKQEASHHGNDKIDFESADS